jgi:hypothetical protein
MEEALTLIPWEYEIQKKGRVKCPIQKLLILIREYINDPRFFLLFAHDKGKPYGYCMALLSRIPDNKTMFILRMYGPGIVNEFLDELKKYGKQFKVNLIKLAIKKDIRAIERLYGFKQTHVNMELEIT